MIEKTTQDENEVGLIIKQNKKAGSKVMEKYRYQINCWRFRY